MHTLIFRRAMDRYLDTDQDKGGGGENADQSQNKDAKSGGTSDDGNEDQSSRKDDNEDEKGDEKGKTFSQEDVNRIVSDRLREERKRITADVRKEIKTEAEQAAAKEQGDFKKLYESEKEAHDKLKADVAKREDEEMRKRIARDAKLPESAWKRLVGDNEAELKADAKAMAKDFVTRKDVNIDAGNTRNKVITEDKTLKDLEKPAAWGLPYGE